MRVTVSMHVYGLFEPFLDLFKTLTTVLFSLLLAVDQPLMT